MQIWNVLVSSSTEEDYEDQLANSADGLKYSNKLEVLEYDVTTRLVDGFSTLDVEVQCVFSDCFVRKVPRYIRSMHTLLFLPLRKDSSRSEAVSGPVLKK
uniref:AlNc14C273G10000 protein n=1 Tax=Albugo laibachii Nc14 TaxID=890382 RepID=F0WUI9_9STRA|nr:AlNc14C273G10000 [Albugo laibachii Nc14]|eukprot:CCA25070.1 AlNc14C273G10000 [Albugo laibachii Nc14]